MSVNRRGFIGGMVAALAGGGEALVRLANPDEQALIRVGDSATVLAPHGLKPRDIPRGSPGQFYLAMISSDGKKHEIVGFARDFTIQSSMDSIDVTTFGGTVETYVAGRIRGDVTLTWPGDPDSTQAMLAAWR